MSQIIACGKCINGRVWRPTVGTAQGEGTILVRCCMVAIRGLDSLPWMGRGERHTHRLYVTCTTDVSCNFGEERSEPAFTVSATTETIALVVHIVTSESTARVKGEHNSAAEGCIAGKPL